MQDGSEYYLSIDSVVMVTNPDMIQHLLKINKYVNPASCVVLPCGVALGAAAD